MAERRCQTISARTPVTSRQSNNVWTSSSGRTVEFASAQEKRLLEQSDRLQQVIDRRRKAAGTGT